MAKTKAQIKKELDVYDSGYNNGYYDAVYSLSWECGDCGNRYDPVVTICPNDFLHKAKLNDHDDNK